MFIQDEPNEEVSTNTETPVTEAVIENEPEVTEPAVETTDPQEVSVEGVDRSAYNCPDCGGEGLKKAEDGSLVDCANCGNTGRV